MEDQNTNTKLKEGFFTKSYLRYIAAFLGLIVLVGGSYFVWDGYFSESAKYGRQVEENMKKYNEWERNYTKAMTEDVYGGKTPQETLSMFIDALKKEDVELAGKYFLLNSVGQIDQKWVDGLRVSKNEGKLSGIAKELETAKLNEGSSILNTAWFKIFTNDGAVSHEILLSLNEFSKVWKIESL